MKQLSVFFCGWLFAIGLGVAGMTQPAKIIGFLDVAGAWDPSLMFVMGGAVALGLATFPLVLKRPSPLLEERFVLPDKAGIDRRLLAGASLFGVGWGLSGYCPGPALVSLVTFNPSVLVFVASMLAGLGLGQWLAAKTRSKSQ
jgi:uncharacterized membrane protein YedE/YeeE